MIDRNPRAPVWRLIASLAISLIEFELDPVVLEEFLELLHERVLRLRQDLDQRSFIELVESRDDREASDELRNQSELHEIFRLHLGQ